VLFQLPPYLRLDLDRLESFLRILPTGLRCAFEFRHESWFTADAYALLREHNVSLCLAESEKLEVPEVTTADFVYHRLRRPSYAEADLQRFAAHAREQLAAGRDVYTLFKHEDDAGGALDAERLLTMVRGAAPRLKAA
jgi:uncharacterized protein YecE (DUF72 family)